MRSAILALAFALAFASSPVGQADTVGITLRDWEKTNAIDISEISEGNLQREIPRLAHDLGLIAENAPTTPAYRQFVIETLTANFLYWSRDAAGTNVKRLGETTTLPNRFQAFLQELTWLKGRAVGRIQVTSNPPSAVIEVDGSRKGLTESVIAASAGSHKVVIRPAGKNACSHNVSVSQGATEKVDCR